MVSFPWCHPAVPEEPFAALWRCHTLLPEDRNKLMTLCWVDRQRESPPPEEEWSSCNNDVGTLEWYTVAFQPSEGSVRGAWP